MLASYLCVESKRTKLVDFFRRGTILYLYKVHTKPNIYLQKYEKAVTFMEISPTPTLWLLAFGYGCIARTERCWLRAC